MYFIGVDLGTSSVKLILTDENLKIVKTVSKEYPLYFPKDGYSEQDPADWLKALKIGIKELTSDIDKDKVEAIGVGGQMHGLVVLDKNDNIIRNAILWNDGRTGKETKYLNEIIGRDKLSTYTNNIAFTGFTAPKILWLENNEKDNFDKIEKIMLPKDYVVYSLTGVHATDYSDASGMLLLDVKNKKWSKEMCDICHIKESMLPKLYESYDIVGNVSPKMLDEIGLKGDIKVIAGAGDNAAAAIGTGTSKEGKCNISLGTSGTIFISSDKPVLDDNNALHSFCHANGKYHIMGCMLSAASCNKWFIEDILKTDDYGKETAAIKEDHLGENNVFFLPYLMGERSPLNDESARAVFFGMSMDTKREEMLQSILEGVAFAMKDQLEIAKNLGIDIKTSTICGGGVKTEIWKKIIANVLGIKLEILKYNEGPSLGACIMCAYATGHYKTLDEAISKVIEVIEVVEPDKGLCEKYAKKYSKFKAIYPALKNIYKM